MAVSVSVNKGAVASGNFYFCQTETTPYLFFHNVLNGYVVDGSTGVLSSVTDVNFPPNQTPARNLAAGSVYLDGYVCVLTTDGRIYNSNSEDPTTWNSLNYLTKTAEPDGGVAIARHLNYIVAFGAWSTEFMYNAGNPTGSPFSRNTSAEFKIGCVSGDSVVQFQQTLAWVGQSKEYGKGVYLLDGLSPVKVSTTSVEYYLNASAFTNTRAWTLTTAGHTFYVLSLVDLDITLVYDLNEKEWYTWTSTDSTNTESYFTAEFFASLAGIGYVLDGSSGTLSVISNTNYMDGNLPITFRIVTDPMDFETNARKLFSSVEVIGDRSGATLSLNHTDDDYATFSNERTVSLLKTRPIIYQLGSSRKRAYQVLTRDSTSVRVHSLEFNIVKGES